MKLDSTVAAVVTGGASGLGEATARALAAKGVKVAIFDLQADKGEALAAEIGGVFCNVNVTSAESVDAGFATALARATRSRPLAVRRKTDRSSISRSMRLTGLSRSTWLGHSAALPSRQLACLRLSRWKMASVARWSTRRQLRPKTARWAKRHIRHQRVALWA